MRYFYDIKQSLKSIYRDYEYSTIIVVLMALTLAVALFFFTMLYSIQYKPLPLANEPEKFTWGTIKTNGSEYFIGGLSNHTFEYLRQHQTTLDHFGRLEQGVDTLSNFQAAEKYRGAAVSSELFQALGVSALLGRVLLPGDDVYGSQKNIVISYRLWETFFNKSENILGQTVKLNGEIANIVGVMPDNFRFPINHDVWYTRPIMAGGEADHGGWNSVFGRLKPGVEMTDVEAQFQLIAQEINKNYPSQYKGKDIALTSFTHRWSQYLGFLVPILKISCIAILLMGCFSVSNLIIVRNLENAKESMIKSALGIPLTRILITPLLQSFWLCLLAAVIGIWLCFLGIKLLGSNVLEGPYWWSLEFTPIIFYTGIGVAALIWVGTSFFPVYLAMRNPTNRHLSSGRKGGTGTTLSRIMIGFSSLQIFGAFVLMVFTGVLIGGLIKVVNSDYGVPRDGYLTAEVKLSGTKYESLAARNEYYVRFVERALSIQGIQSGAVSGALPGASGFLSNYASTERNIEVDNSFPKAFEIPVSEDYFKVMDIKLIEGRYFTAADKEGSSEVAIINQSMAATLFSGESAVGKQFQYDPENEGQLLTVIGVVPDVVTENPLWYLSSESNGWRAQMYRPITQKQPEWDSNSLIFKTDLNPYDLVSQIKAVARDTDPEIPVYDIKSYDDFLAKHESGFRKLILTFMPAAFLAAVIAIFGVYSITRRLVLQNMPDIGIMRALGIDDRNINRKFLGSSVIQLAVGLGVGIIFSLTVLPTLPSSILITDINMILTASALIAVVIGVLVLAASYIPLMISQRLSPRDAINYLSVKND